MKTLLLATAASFFFLSACTPEVRVQAVAPEKPIEINLNVNIDHRIRVEIEKDVQDTISSNPDIF